MKRPQRCLGVFMLIAGGAACEDSTSREFYPTPAIGRGAAKARAQQRQTGPSVEASELTPEEQAERAREELRAAGGSEQALHGRMQENFVRADQLQKAVIAADLPAVRESGRWVATHSTTAGFPDEWVGHLTTLRRAAQTVADAEDLDSAARATAFVAGACGDCHTTQVGGRDQGAEPLPRFGEGLELDMKRLQWAADRLWDAVISGRDTRWADAVAVLEETPIRLADLDVKPKDRRSTTAQLERYRAAIARAKTTPTRDLRVRAVGELLASCAGCHARLDGGPEAW